MSGFTLPVETAGQDVHWVTETATAALDHTTSYSRHLEQFGSPFHLNAPQRAQRICFHPLWLDRVGKKPSVKADLTMYSYIVTVTG